jgi:hypothetical protein
VVDQNKGHRVKTKRWYRSPTKIEIAAFDGLHCEALYRWAIAHNWHCPSCGRTAIELIRWSEIRGPSMRQRYGDVHGMGFTISLTRHHCHGVGRFPEILICGDCNAADGAAKRKLRLPRDWSFAAYEIKQFVNVVPHSGKTIIDYDRAHEIYKSL